MLTDGIYVYFELDSSAAQVFDGREEVPVGGEAGTCRTHREVAVAGAGCTTRGPAFDGEAGVRACLYLETLFPESLASESSQMRGDFILHVREGIVGEPELQRTVGQGFEESEEWGVSASGVVVAGFAEAVIVQYAPREDWPAVV